MMRRQKEIIRIEIKLKMTDSEAHAIESIEAAMANGWKGIYPQKILNNGKQSNKNGLSYSTEFQEELARKIQS